MGKAKDQTSPEKEKVVQSLSYAKTVLISKRNDMIQNSRMNLTNRQQKIVNYAMSKIRPGDTVNTEYIFSARECGLAMGLKGKSIYNYAEITDELKKLADKSWLIRVDDHVQIVRWFNTIHIQDKDPNHAGTYKIKFHEDMAPYLFNLAEQKKEKGIYFSSYPSVYALPMKCRYSFRLYEILKSYQFNRMEWYFELPQLKEMLAYENGSGDGSTPTEDTIPKNWSNFAIFRRDVLEPAKKEINLFTDIKIDYKALKQDASGNSTRGYSMIHFFFDEKTDNEKIEADTHLAEAMEVYDYEQLSLFGKAEDYEAAKQEFIEERAMIREEEKAMRREERISRSKYQVLTDTFFEFTDEEIERLYALSVKKLDIERVDFKNWELWICDYITYYYDKIKATPKKTKTTEYNRLVDSISKDYDLYNEVLNDSWNTKEKGES